jgi:Vacuolar protein sorting-associated protein 62
VRRCFRSGLCVVVPVVAIVFVIAGCGSSASCTGAGGIPQGAGTAAERPITGTSPAVAGLARQFAPTVVMSKLDRFWPVSVATVLQEQGPSGGGVTLVSNGRVVTDPTLADLKPTDSANSYLDYPAGLADKAGQMDAFLRGIGVPDEAIAVWPKDLAAVAGAASRTAQIYFYDADTGCSYGGQTTTHYRALQYWFFYALNYYPMTVDTTTMLTDPVRADTADVDLHEGDWEHITVLVGKEEGQYVPKYVWMARHSGEGVLISWDQVEQNPPGHPVVYPAFGGHPSYPSCGAHGRAILAAAVYDYAVCGPEVYTFSGATTQLVDLAHVGWSCWPGYFGTIVGTTGSGDADDPTGQILVAGPRSPLRQAENQHVCRTTSG